MIPPNSPGSTSRRTALETVSGLLPYLWPRGDIRTRLHVVGAILLLIAAKVATICVPLVYARAVDRLSHNDPTHMLAVPVGLIVGYGLLRIATGAFGELRDAVFSPVKQRVIRVAAMQTFRHLHRLSLRFHLDRQTGGVTRAVERGTQAIELILRLGIFNIVPTLIETLMVTAVIWTLFDWRFAAATLTTVVVYVGFTIAFTGWRIGIRRKMNEVESEASTKALDSLLNYETVKYFGNEGHEARRYDETQARYERAAVRTQVSLNMLNIGQSTIIAVALAAIMLMAAQGVASGKLSVGKFVLVNTYLMQLYQPLNLLGFVYSSLRQSLVDLEQMFRLLGEAEEVEDPAIPILLPARLEDAPPAEVRFDGVKFGYQSNREILHGVSFSVQPGGRTAIVGPTGAGKSTISRLLFRFYDVNDGRVLLDGRDVRDYSQESLRAAIGVVPQDTVLFNDTIRYNIAYGRIGATQAEVEHAAQLAQVHDFVMRLPEGYDTRVGERGLKLSGGEKQRVAIARTILKNPRVLILDEATSALDTHTEQEIQSALRTVATDRTTLVIAHRLSTVVDADEILVLVDGLVAERGTHRDLLATGGVYARMWAAQSEEEAAQGHVEAAEGPRSLASAGRAELIKAQ
ncbi:ABC transporter ATP-binding protein/permease [Lichenicola cladoniae]|uniref:ABC transporter ATP-binding protein/permease n=1 Tax=Lichenicola cladoniae TaxID=1484109 RepID=A0A6M8HQ42_9PROT|nr:ABC transporter ATP-binding protein/permease [Lichenicola cladoniae]NPD67954.1 ABC transporter ATP-binding protein/permease [Acetobacteraceae bacterium]QKE90544.1 ABC transporter ATP-binding protein/permease [Lichenicola cladoniae]